MFNNYWPSSKYFIQPWISNLGEQENHSIRTYDQSMFRHRTTISNNISSLTNEPNNESRDYLKQRLSFGETIIF